MNALDRLAAALGRLPGIGRRSAERIAMKLARDADSLVPDLVHALEDVRRSLCCCKRCGSITPVEQNPCRLCTSDSRDGRVLCVVEDPNDILVIERSGSFNGRYHALMGRLSPGKAIGPDELRRQALVKRIEEERFEEVILALGTDVEGDATASYLAELLRPLRLKITRLAYGLPVGSGLSYADAVTVGRAIRGRQSA